MAVVLILKWTVWPWLTLISVAKPWMLRSPASLMSHSVEGLPGFEFSQAMAFAIGGLQEKVCAFAKVTARLQTARSRNGVLACLPLAETNRPNLVMISIIPSCGAAGLLRKASSEVHVAPHSN